MKTEFFADFVWDIIPYNEKIYTHPAKFVNDWKEEIAEVEAKGIVWREDI